MGSQRPLHERLPSPSCALPACSICGFFGDHWQQIYEKACGALEDARLTPVVRRRNRRSQRAVVNLLNTMRPELPQATASGAGEGTVAI
ncbi:hypothetical protein OG840_38610 [Streptomyces sp. NBC_01764]|uniref:hypothetical protein n=1 Tax=Streptomyces sp. NBC_01764 TaxID=2975935 RepID=UPI00225AAB30|nr:hypothetical protein [Streptomyces sp. NBC_01764]MCX4407346.1 hypothetical protein [Streptomyces sp. NBC_01764]